MRYKRQFSQDWNSTIILTLDLETNPTHKVMYRRRRWKNILVQTLLNPFWLPNYGYRIGGNANKANCTGILFFYSPSKISFLSLWAIVCQNGSRLTQKGNTNQKCTQVVYASLTSDVRLSKRTGFLKDSTYLCMMDGNTQGFRAERTLNLF